MSGQYNISEELLKAIKKEVEQRITSYKDDLYIDNDISIVISSTEWADYPNANFKPYIQFN